MGNKSSQVQQPPDPSDHRMAPSSRTPNARRDPNTPPRTHQKIEEHRINGAGAGAGSQHTSDDDLLAASQLMLESTGLSPLPREPVFDALTITPSHRAPTADTSLNGKRRIARKSQVTAGKQKRASTANSGPRKARKSAASPLAQDTATFLPTPSASEPIPTSTGHVEVPATQTSWATVNKPSDTQASTQSVPESSAVMNGRRRRKRVIDLSDAANPLLETTMLRRDSPVRALQSVSWRQDDMPMSQYIDQAMADVAASVGKAKSAVAKVQDDETPVQPSRKRPRASDVVDRQATVADSNGHGEPPALPVETPQTTRPRKRARTTRKSAATELNDAQANSVDNTTAAGEDHVGPSNGHTIDILTPQQSKKSRRATRKGKVHAPVDVDVNKVQSIDPNDGDEPILGTTLLENLKKRRSTTTNGSKNIDAVTGESPKLPDEPTELAPSGTPASNQEVAALEAEETLQNGSEREPDPLPFGEDSRYNSVPDNYVDEKEAEEIQADAPPIARSTPDRQSAQELGTEPEPEPMDVDSQDDVIVPDNHVNDEEPQEIQIDATPVARVTLDRESAQEFGTDPSPSEKKVKRRRQSKKTNAEQKEGNVQEPSNKKKRKRKSVIERPEVENDVERNDNNAIREQAAKRRSGGAEAELAVEHTLSQPLDLRDSGDFSEDEAELLRQYIRSYQHENDLNIVDLVRLIQWTNTAKQTSERHGLQDGDRPDIHQYHYSRKFWSELYDVLPKRKSAKAKGGTTSIQRFVRRKYHNFKGSGGWDEEEDARLKEAYDQHPQQWKKISAIMGDRAEEACRDRWRNYGQYGIGRNSSTWSEEETDRFNQAVDEVIALAQLAPEDVTSGNISWQAVSERMGGTRSRLQCRSKWISLREATQYPAKGRKSLQAKKKRTSIGITPSKRRSAFEKMRPGDKLDVIGAIMEQTQELDSASREDIDWEQVNGEINSTFAFSTEDRQKALGELLDVVGEQESFSDALQAIVEHLGDAYGNELDDRYDPASQSETLELWEVPDILATPKKSRKRKSKVPGTGPKSMTRTPNAYKSHEFILDSDAED